MLSARRNWQVQGNNLIGGSGSQSGAADLSEKGYPVVGVASTIDNDLYGTEVSIGVDTALNTAMEAVDRLRVTASSHRKAHLRQSDGCRPTIRGRRLADEGYYGRDPGRYIAEGRSRDDSGNCLWHASDGSTCERVIAYERIRILGKGRRWCDCVDRHTRRPSASAGQKVSLQSQSGVADKLSFARSPGTKTILKGMNFFYGGFDLRSRWDPG
ncbi:MAG: 6-phosphofructokinase [Verrucomicrobia bacterium]|nr:6-phosphofructokinase [Verrucomicrobiota bacterium]